MKKMSLLKKLLLACTATFALLVVGVVIFAATFDVNRYQPQLIDWVKTNKQRTLVMQGPLRLSVFPRLSITATGVQLSEHKSAEVFFKAQEVSASLQLLPLLARRVELGVVQAQGVELHYQRNAKGVSNIDDLLDSQKSEPSQPKPATAPPPAEPNTLAVDVQGITLRDVTLQVQDDVAGITGTARLAQLQVGHLAQGLATPVKLDLALDFSRPRLQGTLQGSAVLQLNQGQTTLTKTDLVFTGNTPFVTNAVLRVQGDVGVDTTASALSLQTFKASLAGQIGGLAVKESSLQIKQLAYTPQAKTLRLQGLALRVEALQQGQTLQAQLDWPQLEVAEKTVQGSALAGSFSMAGTSAVAGKFTSGAPTGSFERLRIPAFAFNLDGGAQGSGSVKADLLLQPTAQQLAVENLTGQLQVPLAQKQQSVSVAGSARYVGALEKTATWQLQGNWGAAPYSTAGTAAFKTKLPLLNASFQLASLDVDALTPASKKDPSATKSDATKDQKQSDTLDLSLATAFQGSINAAVEKLTLRGIVFDKARLRLRSDGQRLDVDSFAAQVWQGAVSGSGAVVPSRHSVALQGVAEGIRIEQALKALTGRDKISGAARVAFNVSSNGLRVAQMRSALAGKAQVQLRDGAVKGINLAKTLRQAKAAFTLRQDSVQAARQDEQTDFSEISASFDIAQGIARSNDLVGKSPFLRVGGQGQADIGQSTMDYLVTATLIADAQGQGAAELAALRGVQVPVRIHGPWDALQYQVQWSAVAQDALKNKLGDALKNKIGLPSSTPKAPAGTPPTTPAPEPTSAKDRLKDKLRGLIR